MRKLALGMVALKERKQSSAASTAAASCGCGGSRGFNSGVLLGVEYGGKSSTWFPTGLELGWLGDRNRVKASAFGLDEVVLLLVDLKTRITANQEARRFDGKLMVFLLFRSDVTCLVGKCWKAHGKPMSEAHAIWLDTMGEVSLDRDLLDFTWEDTSFEIVIPVRDAIFNMNLCLM